MKPMTIETNHVHVRVTIHIIPTLYSIYLCEFTSIHITNAVDFHNTFCLWVPMVYNFGSVADFLLYYSDIFGLQTSLLERCQQQEKVIATFLVTVPIFTFVDWIWMMINS